MGCPALPVEAYFKRIFSGEKTPYRRSSPPAEKKPLSGRFRKRKSGFRFYDAELGRWLKRDPITWISRYPIEENGGRNLYACVSNNPIMSSDILGMLECCGTIQYDPSTQGCCNGKIYNKATHCCCNGTRILSKSEISNDYREFKRDVQDAFDSGNYGWSIAYAGGWQCYEQATSIQRTITPTYWTSKIIETTWLFGASQHHFVRYIFICTTGDCGFCGYSVDVDPLHLSYTV